MKAVLFLLVLLLLSVIPASAADSSRVDGTGSARIDELYSDIESFDVTFYSSQEEENLKCLW
jgi:outer membrane lipoprotein-sorting protein